MIEALKIEALEHDENETATTELVTPYEDLDEELKIAIEQASEKKAVDIVAIDLREITSFTEFFLIANGTNERQVQAIADAISKKLKERKVKPKRIEGYQSGKWILLDYGDFIFHVFDETSRKFYDLERLWRDAKRVNLPEEL